MGGILPETLPDMQLRCKTQETEICDYICAHIEFAVIGRGQKRDILAGVCLQVRRAIPSLAAESALVSSEAVEHGI